MSTSTDYPQIVIVRHGERADKYPELLPLQEINNPALTDAGFLQAVGMGNLLKTSLSSSSALPSSPLHEHVLGEDDETTKSVNSINNTKQRKWRILSSPFLRTIQTSSAIMAALGEENLHSACVEIDFDIGEHMKGPVIPEGVLKLNEEQASTVLKEGYNFSMAKKKNNNFEGDSSSSSSSNNKFSPFVKFGHGDSSHVIPSEPLEASGVRFLKAVERIYRGHISNNSNNNNNEPLPNILIVTHGFAPSQLLKLLYGRDAIDATRVFLCSMMCLQSFESLSSKIQDFVLKNNNNNASSSNNSNGNDPRPSFAVAWTRGVKWRIPRTQARLSNRRRIVNSSSTIPETSSPRQDDDEDEDEDISPTNTNGNKNVSNTSNGVNGEKQTSSTSSLGAAPASSEPPYSPSAEEPDVNGVVEKTWYESRVVNQDRTSFCLGFSVNAEGPPPLIPIGFDAKNSTRLSKSLVANNGSSSSQEQKM